MKHPVLPDAASRAKLVERQSAKYTEKYADYIHLGVIEWRKAYDGTREAGQEGDPVRDDRRHPQLRRRRRVSAKRTIPILKDAVLVIHTKKQRRNFRSDLRQEQRGTGQAARNKPTRSTGWESPYKAIVSVMMLKEGWDVRNVTTIVGLRAYSAPRATSCPSRPWGAGLRKMYPGDVEEYVSVVGTDAFMEFVESIQAEGVVLERKPMGEGTAAKDAAGGGEWTRKTSKKDIDALDIEIPRLTPRRLSGIQESGRPGRDRARPSEACVPAIQRGGDSGRSSSRTSPPAK